MIVRPATREDVTQLLDILNQIIVIGGTTAYEDPLEADYLERFFAENPKCFLHVAEADGALQGMQWIDALDPPEDHVGGIATFARPGTTQRGIGTALFEVTTRASRAAGFTTLHAKIRADNTGGIAYYTKMGFTPHDVIKAVPLKDGTPVDRVIRRMQLS